MDVVGSTVDVIHGGEEERMDCLLAVVMDIGELLLTHGAEVDRVEDTIMLVLPKIRLTNSLRDMVNRDMISGLLNMSEALLKAIAVAMGFASILLFGGGV